MKYFDSFQISLILRKLGRTLVIALVVMLVGIFIGFMISGQNPLKIFLPSTWIHIFQFLS